MAQPQPGGLGSTPQDEWSSDRRLTLLAYVLHLIGPMSALTLSIAALVLNYLKRDLAGHFGSHHRWMIRSFWWALLWLVLTSPFLLIGIGFAFWGIVFIWWIYRQVRGMVALIDNAALPA